MTQLDLLEPSAELVVPTPPSFTPIEVPQTSTETRLCGPVPPLKTVSGHGERANLMIVGEHYEHEDEPFTSPAGMFFRQLLHDAGYPVPKLAFCHAGPATPVLLELAGARYVLASGQKALNLWRPDLRIKECHGRPFYGTDLVVVWPVISHVGLLREPVWRDVVLHHVGTLRDFAVRRVNDQDWSELWPDSCVRCRGEAWRADPQLVIYCQKHWEQRRPAPAAH